MVILEVVASVCFLTLYAIGARANTGKSGKRPVLVAAAPPAPPPGAGAKYP